ncbi:MAG: hypothetical protein C3F07_10730 [Anaerolineales bacterium]|nr:hypothetical protein [Anaerolineae bacterium]PWB72887.1 MAG: hypothetical protein C3F07_10730 [Anaerolineales bacterium]
MITHQSKVWINRPVNEVFAFVSNKENDLQWQSGLVEVHQPPGPMSVGTQIDEVYSFLGRKVVGKLEVTEYDPGKRITTKSIGGPFHIQYSYVLEAGNGGTQFTMNMEMKPEGFFTLAEPIVGANLKKNVDTDLASLKNVLEK